MLDFTNLKSLMVIDIETVPQVADFEQLDTITQGLWTAKRGKYNEEGIDNSDFYFKNAGILAEFGKIICISTGFFIQNGNQWDFRIKSFYGNDEQKILEDVVDLIEQQSNKIKDFGIAGHNINEFDIPYLCRRILINNVKMPLFLSSMSGKKPWENKNIDTMQLWKFGDYKSYISLKLLTHILNIPSPKDDIDGSQVGGVYYNENEGLIRIKNYCQKDIIAVAQILLKFKNAPQMSENQVSYAN